MVQNILIKLLEAAECSEQTWECVNENTFSNLKNLADKFI